MNVLGSTNGSEASVVEPAHYLITRGNAVRKAGTPPRAMLRSRALIAPSADKTNPLPAPMDEKTLTDNDFRLAAANRIAAPDILLPDRAMPARTSARPP